MHDMLIAIKSKTNAKASLPVTINLLQFHFLMPRHMYNLPVWLESFKFEFNEEQNFRKILLDRSENERDLMVKFMIFRNFMSNILLKSGKIEAGPLVFYFANFFFRRRIFRFIIRRIAFYLIPRNIPNKLRVFTFDISSASLLRNILVSYIFIYIYI